MAIHTKVALSEATNIPTFPVLRQNKQTGRVYMFTGPMQATLLALGPNDSDASTDILGKTIPMVSKYTDSRYVKCSITLSSKD